MGETLRVLLVEDNPDDAELILRELRRGGFEPSFRRVDDAEAFREALTTQAWDVILSDYVLPGFDGLRALEIVAEKALDLPFILVSGQIGDEVAVSVMKAGCADYVPKENLARLAPAIRRELREARIRRERRHAREALRFLAEVSAAFVGSLDYEETIRVAARQAVPYLADICVIDVIDEGGRVRRLGQAQSDPALEQVLRDLATSFPSVPGSPNAAAQAMQTGRSVLIAEVDEDRIATFSREPRHREMLRSLGLRSGLAVPLVARGKIIGALTLGYTQRTYSKADVATAEDFARRAALSIENARLYREARRAVEETEHALAEAQEAIRVRDEFLSVASHELKTPLTALKVQIGNIGRSVRDEKLATALAGTRRQIDRLALLIDNLLDVSRLAASGVSIEPGPVDLVELVHEVVERNGAQLRRAGCPVVFEMPASVSGVWDRSRIEQVLGNLLSNAVKFGAGKPIEIAVRPVGDRVRLTVRDYGIGIAPEDAQRIFERFERAVSARHYGGLGLGLFITRQIVEAHGGSIRVESPAGGGSAFTVELPLVTGGREEASWAH